MNLRSLGFIETSSLTAKLILSYRSRFVESEDGTERMALIADGKPNTICTEWNSAKALLARLRQESASFFGKPAGIENAFIERIKPMVCTPWEEDETELLRVSVCLVPSPGAWLYCGGESAVLQVGQLVLVNTRAMHCQANFGPCARIALHLDITRPD